jgi:hypothetical protein
MTEPGLETKPYLTVYTIDHDHKAYSFTPFVTKLHFRLRYGRLPYDDGKFSRAESPKGKIPYVKFNETGELMGDSALITRKLIEMGKLGDLNAKLSREDKAKDYCLRSTIEEKLYYFVVRSAQDFVTVVEHPSPLTGVL